MEKLGYRSPLVLPKLKAKAELLQALPELRKYFPDAADLIPAERHRGAAARRPAAPAAEDSDDEEKEAAKMVEELRRVKKERTVLLQSLAAARGKTAGRPAGDLQAQDIAALRTSLAEKQQVLNELRERNAELEQRIEVLSLESRDCSLLVPEEGGGAAGEMGDRLAVTLAEHEAAAKEIETRTVQYQLLADRTTHDRDDAEHRMKLARELKEAAEDDLHTLRQHYYEMHAAKENAERELGVAVAQYDDSKTAWQRKLRDRRREMKAVERRLAEETAEQAQRDQQAALEAAQRAKEREAAQAQQYAAVLEENNPIILERLQEAEAIWSRLRAVSGGSSPEEIIAAWQDLRDRAQALQGLLAMTRRQEDQRREELTELQQLQASQLTADNAKLTFIDDLNPNGASDEEKKKEEEEEELHQKQQSVKRLESLCAASELSLKGLLDRFNASQESNSELWKTLRAQQQQQQQQHRKSVVGSAAGPHPHRRASVLLPRRVSAVDLAHARSAAAHTKNRRGSIEIPIDSQQPPQQQQETLQQQRASVICSIREGPVSSIQEEQTLNSNTVFSISNNILSKNSASRASTSTATATTTKKNEFFPELPDAVAELAHHFDLLLSLEHYSFAGNNKIDQIQSSPAIENQSATEHVVERSTHSLSSGYKRSTMAGPAWMENKPATPAKTKALTSHMEEEVATKNEKENSGAETSKAARQSVVAGAVSPRSERQQAQHEVQAAERYMRRLIGATVEPAPEIEDPFALDSSDEDERPVFDRSALKHRSYKVTHPKQPRNIKNAPKSSPKPTRGSPGGGISLALLSPK